MARWVSSQQLSECNMEEVMVSIHEHEAPLQKVAGDIEVIRDALAECMWDDVGISRTRESLVRARQTLQQLAAQLNQMGVGDIQRQYSNTWQDWMNLQNLILVSQAVTEAALARENSRGAHYREDFPEPGSLEDSYYTTVNFNYQELSIKNLPVQFTMIKPGQTMLVEA
jgi:fumarate reductase flavoprotein subunit